MKLLANENFAGLAVAALRDAGHDVFWVRTDRPGAMDDVLLHKAQDEERLVVTFDKDFGELAFRWGLARVDRKDGSHVMARSNHSAL